MSDVSNTKPSLTAEAAPARFSADAKAEWDTISETVRSEVLRMERELTAGIEKYRVAAERDASLAAFHDRAAKGGTTIKEALPGMSASKTYCVPTPIKGWTSFSRTSGFRPAIGQRRF
jgi:hypothetical protein